MAVTRGQGNPKWTRDETILALDLYLDVGGKIPSKLDDRVQELSELLRAFPYHARAARKESFRNSDGVAFKLQNLRQVATGRGLSNASNMDRAVWEELGNNPVRVKELAAVIRAGIRIVADNEDEGDDEDETFTEGSMGTIAHKRRERNRSIRKKLLKKRKKEDRLSCEVCGTPPAKTKYGESIFEAHHILPLSLATERKTKLSDMALLCANCHKMLHRAISLEKRWIDIAEAIKLL